MVDSKVQLASSSRIAHYFVDESGDGVLFNAKGQVLVGQPGGAMGHFIMGLLEADDPVALSLDLEQLRADLAGAALSSKPPSRRQTFGHTPPPLSGASKPPSRRQTRWRQRRWRRRSSKPPSRRQTPAGQRPAGRCASKPPSRRQTGTSIPARSAAASKPPSRRQTCIYRLSDSCRSSKPPSRRQTDSTEFFAVPKSSKEALNKSTSDQRRANPPTLIRQRGFGE